MKRKIIAYGFALSLLLLLSACNLTKPLSQTVLELQEIDSLPIDLKTTEYKLVTNKDLKILFQKYLQIDEMSILLLNQKPQKLSPEYWETYAIYKAKTNEILGDYLSEDIKVELDKQYLHNIFHYPRLIEVDDLIITGFGNVEDVNIISKETQKNKDMYHVRVTSVARVISTDAFNKIYHWDEEKGYFIKDTSFDTEYLDKRDYIRLNLNYWVEVERDEKLLLSSIKEKSAFNLGPYAQANPKNNYFISRLPYNDKVLEDDQAKIYKFLSKFMTQTYNYYDYYRKAYEQDYNLFKIALESDLGLFKVVTLKEENYKLYFDPSIIPLKDDMNFLKFNIDQDVTITPHILSSKSRPIYDVIINTQVELINTKVIYCQYNYQFSFENDMIYSVRFLTKKDIS